VRRSRPWRNVDPTIRRRPGLPVRAFAALRRSTGPSVAAHPLADRYVARIFGENSYSIVDHVERLPAVFAAITG
jgi:hypothetical protein